MTEIVGTTFVNDTKEFADIVESSQNRLFELRVDALEDYDLTDIAEIDKRLIITVRHEKEGGLKKIPEDERLKIFKDLLTVEPSFIDIEFRSDILDEVLDLINGTPTKSIVSYHDFEKTPDLDRLDHIYEKIDDKDPGLIKIVTFCNTPKDNSKILEFVLCRPSLISFCMGKEGMISRIFSLKYCPMTYGSISDSHTAPGQFSVKELKQIKEMLGDE
ncbi:MAG: type I 3-dehydroquinate dehydratase [Thermoplasmatota archaeon]